MVSEFVSVDGVMEDPGGSENSEHGAWTFEYDRGDEGNTFKMDELMDAEVQLLGRVTYEGFAAAWPSRERSSTSLCSRCASSPRWLISISAPWRSGSVYTISAPISSPISSTTCSG